MRDMSGKQSDSGAGHIRDAMQSVKAEGDGAIAYGSHSVEMREWRPTIDPDTSTLRTDDDIDKEIPPVGIVEPLSFLTRFPVLQKFGPLIVDGNVKPNVGHGKLDLSTESFQIVDSIPTAAPMTLCIARGLPTKTISTDHEKNSWLKFLFPDMTCQVAVTLKKNPVVKPSTLDDWEVIIMQVFQDNVEVRNYGASKDPDSVDFTMSQSFQADDDDVSLPILDTLDCVCDSKDPAYSSASRQLLPRKDMQAIMQDKLLFGKVSSNDKPNSSARVSYHRSHDSDPHMSKFFNRNCKWLRAEQYYLNKIEKHSSIITYLTIYNTTSKEIYTPMAAQWFLDCTIRRARGTDDFEWYQTTKDQRVPKALTRSQPGDFININTCLLHQHCVQCPNHSGKCRGYATFNNSVYLEAKVNKGKDSCTDMH